MCIRDSYTLFAFSEEDYDMRVYVECVAQHLYDKYIRLFSDRNARLADYLRGPVTDLIVWDEPDTRLSLIHICR